MVDIRAGFQVFERSRGVARKIVEGSGIPISGRAAHASLVVPQHGYAMPDQKVNKRKKVFAILWSGCGHKDDGGMSDAGGWTDESACKMNIAIGKPNIFTSLHLDAPCDPRCGSGTLPCKRDKLALRITLKL